MDQVTVCSLAIAGACALVSGAWFGGRYLYKRGFRAGEKNREKEIFYDCVWYIPVGSLADFAREAIEERGVSEDYPLLVIRSDKYDYIDSTDPLELDE